MHVSTTPPGQLFAKLILWMNGAGVILVFALMFLICADITGRTVFDHPIAGVTEMVSLSLVACVFLSTRPELPSREWLTGLLMRNRIDDQDRRGLLAGRPLTAAADVGPLVCSCFRVGRNTITEAIKCHGLKSTAQVGTRLKAGTNCGSCLPEIGALLERSIRVTEPA